MNDIEIRKFAVIVEDLHRVHGRDINPPQRKVAALAVLKNPVAGKYAEDLTPLINAGELLGKQLTERALREIKMIPGEVKSYGKAAIVGTAGELEHAAAIIHGKMGGPIRQVVGGGAGIIPSTKKIGGPDAAIDVPLSFIDDVWQAPYLDAMEVRVPGAPAADEIVVAIVLCSGARPLVRGNNTKTQK